MSGGGRREDRGADHEDAGTGRGKTGDGPRTGWFAPLTRSWAAGAPVCVALGFMADRASDVVLGSPQHLEDFGRRLLLLHIPHLAVTVLAVLAAARLLPESHRASRTLYPLGCLTVPLVGLGNGYGVSWEVVGIEGVLMPAVSLVAGAVVGIALDCLAGR
ncbi:hypothetical protein OHT52_09330 [Streptomyces sp. NBC_00247]|uniref:hypothetical protein n=1 Tax=Streptomyces sp. NBC_00247 TaxID=2975689 RepID=UPI002E2C54DA|nr:hypothetical protein [Streptomyces sp. NBC_00247]